MAKRGLSKQEHAFVCSLLEGKGKMQAAVEAGYAPSGAASLATRLLGRAPVQQALKDFYSREEELVGLDRERMRVLLLDVAEVDVADIYDDEGNVKTLSEIPARARKAILGLRKWCGSEGSGSAVKLANRLDAARIYLRHYAPPPVDRGIVLDEAAASLESKLADLARRLTAPATPTPPAPPAAPPSAAPADDDDEDDDEQLD